MFHVQKLVVSGSVERDLLMGDFSMQYRKLRANLFQTYWLVVDDTLFFDCLPLIDEHYLQRYLIASAFLHNDVFVSSKCPLVRLVRVSEKYYVLCMEC
ncbi:hypothetical protein T08_5564 [Trichinella sp. T8]|nr:hypothetical protein T08_5564 [Trichinella sp. T8]